MHTCLKLIFQLTLVVGVPLIAICIADRVTPLAYVDRDRHANIGSDRSYQPPVTLGFPSSSQGSGTR